MLGVGEIEDFCFLLGIINPPPPSSLSNDHRSKRRLLTQLDKTESQAGQGFFWEGIVQSLFEGIKQFEIKVLGREFC